MPGFDGTGPFGQGPRTGWGMGYCGPGRGRPRRFYGFGAGRGLPPWGGGRGRVWGGGFGFRGFRAPYAAPWWWAEEAYDDELEELRKENQELRSRLEKLEKEKGE